MLKKNTQAIRALAGAMSVSALALGLGFSGSAMAASGVANGNAGAQAMAPEVVYNSASGGNNATTSGMMGPAAGPFAPASSVNITNSRHNLGSSNTLNGNHTHNVLSANTAGQDNTVVGTNQICVFCHTPHGFNTTQSAPLWNKGVSPSSTYTVYNAGSNNSSTLDADAPVIGSVSLACLSCHDGTQAMDNMINAPGSGGMTTGYDATMASGTAVGPMNAVSQGYMWGDTNVTNDGFAFMGQGGSGFTPGGFTTGDSPALEGIDLGTDLSNDHPISVQYCGGGIGKTLTDQSSVAGNIGTGNTNAVADGTTGSLVGYANGTCRDRLFNLPTVRVISGQPEFWVDTNVIPDVDAIAAHAASIGGISANPITRDPATVEFYVTDGMTAAFSNPNAYNSTNSGVGMSVCGTGNNGDACGRGFIPLLAGAATFAASSVSGVAANGTIGNAGNYMIGGFGVRTKQDLILYTNNAGVLGSPSVECASCHDPHTPNNGTFLRVSNKGSGLCLSCHVK